MVLDYSKWDALELSDDSDIEVHPNVDKRSFIRAKQNQIHQQRYERRHRIETLKYERIINDGLLQRVDRLLETLRSHEADARNPDEFMMQALMRVAGDPTEDEPPKPPEGVHSKSEQPRYSQMMASLVDQVKNEVGDVKSGDWFRGYLKGIEAHQKKILDLQKELEQKLAELEAEESRKITSDSIHTGFNKSSVTKEKEKPKSKAETVEVLNPGSLSKDISHHGSSGAGTDGGGPVGDGKEADDEHIEPTALGREFAKIKMGDYRECLRFISENREVIAERETDGLLIEAFNAQMDGKAAYSKQCVHQALLLQYCRSLGGDGVGLFFKRYYPYPTTPTYLALFSPPPSQPPNLTPSKIRITTQGHQAQTVFLDDVNNTYTRIKTRVAEIAKTREEEASSGPVEQIQLHAVDPSTKIHINIPQPNSDDEIERNARQIFESFPLDLQKALESGELDQVNVALGAMSVSEAEAVVEQLNEGKMLSLKEGVIDGTTAEGREELERLENEARAEEGGGGKEEVQGVADLD